MVKLCLICHFFVGGVELGGLIEELDEGVEAFQELEVPYLGVDAIGVGRYFDEVVLPFTQDELEIPLFLAVVELYNFTLKNLVFFQNSITLGFNLTSLVLHQLLDLVNVIEHSIDLRLVPLSLLDLAFALGTFFELDGNLAVLAFFSLVHPLVQCFHLNGMTTVKFNKLSI